MTRLLVGNLDCEVEWANGPALPAAVTARLALLATTLRAFARDDDDRLWLPAPVPPTAVPQDGAPRPRLEHGPLARGTATVLAWGATARLDAAASSAADAPLVDPATVGADWQAALAHAPRTSSVIARAANDRRFALALAVERGVALPGARVIESVTELRAHLAAGGADASPDGSWVAKAVWTAAGRDRVRRRGAVVDDATATRVARLLEVHGALVFEPWLTRRLDVGQGGVVLTADHAVLLPVHRGLCDDGGVVRGLVIDDVADLGAADRATLTDTVTAVAARLGQLGYRGPFVVDGFVHDRGLHPLGEINARLTFGLVARAWAERLGTSLALGLDGVLPADGTALVHAPDGSAAAWWAPRR